MIYIYPTTTFYENTPLGQCSLLLQCRMIDLKEYYTTFGLMVTTLGESKDGRLFIPFTNPFLLQCV